MRFEFHKGKVKINSGNKCVIADQDVFATSCERLAAEEVERQAAVLPDTQLRAWIEAEISDKDFRRAVLARVSPEVRSRLVGHNEQDQRQERPR